MDSQNYFCAIPAKVIGDARLSMAQRLLYGVITSYANSSGLCWASNETLASKMPTKLDENGNPVFYAPETISRLVSGLIKYGYFSARMVRDRGGETRYLAMPGEDIERLMQERGIGLDEKIKRHPIDEKIKGGLTKRSSTLDEKVKGEDKRVDKESINKKSEPSEIEKPQALTTPEQDIAAIAARLFSDRKAFASKTRNMKDAEIRAHCERAASYLYDHTFNKYPIPQMAIEGYKSEPNRAARWANMSWRFTDHKPTKQREAPKMSPPRRGPMI